MQVEWTNRALNRLADVAVAAGSLDRQDEIERAVLRITAALAADPWDLGESRERFRRVWFADILVVGFDVDHALEMVTVYHVAPLKPGRYR